MWLINNAYKSTRKTRKWNFYFFKTKSKRWQKKRVKLQISADTTVTYIQIWNYHTTNLVWLHFINLYLIKNVPYYFACYSIAFAISAITVSRIISSLARVPSRGDEETKPGIGVPRAGRSSLEFASNLETFAAALERVNRAAINGRDCDLLGRTTMGPGSERILDRLRALGMLLSPWPRAGCAQIRDTLARSLRWRKKKEERNDLDVPRCGFHLKRECARSVIVVIVKWSALRRPKALVLCCVILNDHNVDTAWSNKHYFEVVYSPTQLTSLETRSEVCVYSLFKEWKNFSSLRGKSRISN